MENHILHLLLHCYIYPLSLLMSSLITIRLTDLFNDLVKRETDGVLVYLFLTHYQDISYLGVESIVGSKQPRATIGTS